MSLEYRLKRLRKDLGLVEEGKCLGIFVVKEDVDVPTDKDLAVIAENALCIIIDMRRTDTARAP